MPAVGEAEVTEGGRRHDVDLHARPPEVVHRMLTNTPAKSPARADTTS